MLESTHVEVSETQLVYTDGGDKYHVAGCHTIQNSNTLEYPRELLEDTEDERQLCEYCLENLLDVHAQYKVIKSVIELSDE